MMIKGTNGITLKPIKLQNTVEKLNHHFKKNIDLEAFS